MRELNVNEIDQVNGGFLPLGVAVAIHIAGNVGSIYAWYKFAVSMK